MLSCWHADPRRRPTFADIQAQMEALLPRASQHLGGAQQAIDQALPTAEEVLDLKRLSKTTTLILDLTMSALS